MELKVSYNEAKKGIELHFSEQITDNLLREVKSKMGFRYSQSKDFWYAPTNPQRNEFVKGLEIQIDHGRSSKSIAVFVSPEHEPSLEKINQKRFTHVILHFTTDKGFNAKSEFIVFEPTKNLAQDLADRFGKLKYGSGFKEASIFPRTHVKEARKLFSENKVITVESFRGLNPSKEGSQIESSKEINFNKTESKNPKTKSSKKSNLNETNSMNSKDQSLKEINDEERILKKQLSKENLKLTESNFKKLNELIPDLEEKVMLGHTSGESRIGIDEGSSNSFLMSMKLQLNSESSGIYNITLSHVYEQGEKLIADPKIITLIDFKNGRVQAINYRDSFGLNEKILLEDSDEIRDRSLNQYLTEWITNMRKIRHRLVWDETASQSGKTNLNTEISSETINSQNLKKHSVKEITLTIEGYSREPEYDKGVAFKDWTSANDYIKVNWLGKASDVFYKIIWKNDEQIEGMIDLEPSDFHKAKLILSDWIDTFYFNVSQADPNEVLTQEQIDRVTFIIENHEFYDSKEEGSKEKQASKASYVKASNQFKSQVYFDAYKSFQKLGIGDPEPKDGIRVHQNWLDENYQFEDPKQRQAVIDDYKRFFELKKSWKPIGERKPTLTIYEKNFNKLIKLIPDLKDQLEKGVYYAKSSFKTESNPNPAFMDLSLDVLGKSDGKYEVALSHYYQQNGDSVPDPDMQINIDFEGKMVEALTYQDIRVYQEVYFEENGKRMFRPKLKTQLNTFLGQWLSNLKKQGHKLIWDEPEVEETESLIKETQENKTYYMGEKDPFKLNQGIEAFITEKDKKKESYSAEEIDYISKYTGSGGLAKSGATGKGLLYEYYTPDFIIKKMWGLAFKYGFATGSVLEPSCGIGDFFKYLPQDSKAIAYETNPISARIAKIRFPFLDVKNSEFEKHFFNGKIHLKKQLPRARFDLVIGNPPYGDFTGKYAGLGEKKATKAVSYEDYFVSRGFDLLNEGGLLVLILPSGWLSNKPNATKSKIIDKGGVMKDSYRLPNKIFPTTEVGTDIVIIKKQANND